MITARGDIKLLDFGIVKAGDRRATRAESGMVKGSLGFMSPEQARGRAIDHRSDLFSLGLLLYSCFSGRSLYEGETTYELMLRAAKGPQDGERTRIAALPEPLGGIVRRALATDVDARFQSAAALAAALEPHVGCGTAELARLMRQLFGRELREEARRFGLADAGSPAAGAPPRVRATLVPCRSFSAGDARPA
jgi:serine/threonine protein kinase